MAAQAWAWASWSGVQIKPNRFSAASVYLGYIAVDRKQAVRSADSQECFFGSGAYFFAYIPSGLDVSD